MSNANPTAETQIKRPLTTPVALIIFNRPDTTAAVFKAIARAKPEKLLVIADGPRTAEEEPKCRQARAVASQVDWPCEVLTHFSDKNLGCGVRPATGLDWVFSQVEQAIILEDDCVPSPSFFFFCQELLEHYRDNERVMHISGNNFQDGIRRGNASYYFSKYSHNWGWATWRRAWRHFDYQLKDWPAYQASGEFKSICPDALEQKYWSDIFDHVHRGVRDIWDAQWLFSCWRNRGACVLPNVNLVSNVGHGAQATHTVERTSAMELPAQDIWNIQHPPAIELHREADRYTFDRVFGGRELRRQNSLPMRLRRRLSGLKRRVTSWW